MFTQDRFDKYAQELEQELEDGFLTKDQFRVAMRELVTEFTDEYDEGWDG